MLGVSTRKDLNIYNLVCYSFRWLVGTRPWFMNIYYCLYHIQADLGAPCWIPNQRPTAPSSPGEDDALLPVLPKHCPESAWQWGWACLQGCWSECRALRCGKCTSCSSKKAQISVYTQLSVCLYEICSETTVVMAQCRGSGWTNTEIKTKLTDVFQVQFFGSFAFQRK